MLPALKGSRQQLGMDYLKIEEVELEKLGFSPLKGQKNTFAKKMNDVEIQVHRAPGAYVWLLEVRQFGGVQDRVTMMGMKPIFWDAVCYVREIEEIESEYSA